MMAAVGRVLLIAGALVGTLVSAAGPTEFLAGSGPASEPEAVGKAAWRSFGVGTGCGPRAAAEAAAAPPTAAAPAPAAWQRIAAGVPSAEACKRLCEASPGCRGVEFEASAGTCALAGEEVRVTRLAAGKECLSLTRAGEGQGGVKVFVMLPLDTISSEGTIANSTALTEMLDKMQWAGVNGFMVDVWWGLTETQPKVYNFDAYHQLFEMARVRGWEVQAVASFHQCGGNYGDTCNITLPNFVYAVDGIWYKDAEGAEVREYISLFADNVPVAGGRTPLDMYRDWLEAFAEDFSEDLGGLIVEVMVGMGPAGELRYPSYRSSWTYCGLGEFQAFDGHARASLEAAAAAAQQPSWGAPPEVSLTGTYKSHPYETEFFSSGFQTDYGKFFLEWYSSALKDHGGRVLSVAKSALRGKARISGKVAGVHWWYDSDSHAAEATAGYYNTNFHNAYDELAQLFAEYGAALDFTSLEMRNDEGLVHHVECRANPEALVQQTLQAAAARGVLVGGENALQRYDDWAYGKIQTYKASLSAFTYLRLTNELIKPDNLARFRSFVSAMQEGGKDQLETQASPSSTPSGLGNQTRPGLRR